MCEFLTNGLIGFIQLLVHAKPVACAASVFGLFLFSLPAQGQEERKNPWSLEPVQNMTPLSFLREATLDSIAKKLARFEGDSLKRTAKLSGFAHPVRKEPETLTGNNKPQALLRSLPALYAQKNANLPSLERATSFHFRDFVTNGLFQSDQIVSTASFGVEATVGGVPFSERLTAAYPSAIEGVVTPHFKMNFEREAFLQSLRKRLAQHYDPEKVLLKDLDFQGIIKNYAQRKIQSVKSTYEPFLSSSTLLQNNFSNLSVDEFLLLTKEQLRSRIKDRFEDSLAARRAAVTRKIAASGQKDTFALRMQLDNIDSSLAALQNLTDHVTRVKDEFETTGVNYNQLVQYQRTINGEAQSLISSERFVQESAQNLFRSKGFAGLFVYLRHFTAGQFSSAWDGHSISGIMTSGIAGDFFKKNKFFGAQFCRIENLGWLKDGAYSGNFFEPRALLQAVRVGSGQLEKEHVHLSLLNSTSLNA